MAQVDRQQRQEKAEYNADTFCRVAERESQSQTSSWPSSVLEQNTNRSSSALQRPVVRMVVKEEISLLPSSVKGATGVKERRMSIKRSFHWLQIATLALIIGWLALLSVRSWQPVLSEELVRSLTRGHT